MSKTELDINQIVHGFDEFTNQVLKSHLILERRIDVLLQLVCKSPKAVSSHRFGFWEKCRVLEALLGPQKKNVWEALDKFNAIRNELAHTLDAPNEAKLVNDFISALGLKTKGMEDLKAIKECRMEACFLGFIMILDWLDKMKESVQSKLVTNESDHDGCKTPSAQFVAE